MRRLRSPLTSRSWRREIHQSPLRVFRFSVGCLHTVSPAVKKTPLDKHFATIADLVTKHHSGGLSQIPLSTLAAQLPEDVMDDLEHCSLKDFFEAHHSHFTVEKIPGTSRYGVKQRVVTSPPPDPDERSETTTSFSGLHSRVAPRPQIDSLYVPPPPPVPSRKSRPLESETFTTSSPSVGSNKTVMKRDGFVDCWNDPQWVARDLFAEHAALLSKSSRAVNNVSNPFVSFGGICLSDIPLKLTPLERWMECIEHHRQECAANGKAMSPKTVTRDDLIHNVLIPNQHFFHVAEVAFSSGTRKTTEPSGDTSGSADFTRNDESVTIFSAEATWKRLTTSPAVVDSDGCTTRTLLFVSLNPHCIVASTVDEALASPVHQRLASQRYEPQEFDAYRLARFSPVDKYIPWKDLLKASEGVLAADGIESIVQVVLAFPQLFEVDDMKISTGVRFRLHPDFVPNIDKQEKEVEAMLEVLKNLDQGKLKNKERVMVREKKLYYRRVLAMRAGLVSGCDPDVLAYWIYDAIEPYENMPPPCGMACQLLPKEVQMRTNGRSKTFLKRYPHLFKFVKMPTLGRSDWRLIRSDWTADAISIIKSTEYSKTLSDISRKIEACSEDSIKERRSNLESDGSPGVALHKLERMLTDSSRLFLTEVTGGLRLFLESNPELFRVANDEIHGAVVFHALDGI